MTNPELMTGLGAAAALFLACAGSAFASAHAGLFVMRAPGLKAFVPIVIGGVLAIYGIIVAVILTGKLNSQGHEISQEEGYKDLSAGLAVGLACLCSGMGMAKFLDMYMKEHSGNKKRSAGEGHTNGHVNGGESQPLLHDTGLMMVDSADNHAPPLPPVNLRFCFVLVYLEAIGLYGLIVALLLSG